MSFFVVDAMNIIVLFSLFRILKHPEVKLLPKLAIDSEHLT